MRRLAMFLAVPILVADQASKGLVMDRVLAGQDLIVVTPFFNLVTVWNRGVSFGLFNRDWAGTPWLLSALALVVVGFLWVWLGRARRRLTALCLGAVIAGAVANVIDRVRFGAVYDFLDFHYAGWHWPAFNLADSAITLGVVGLLIDALLAERRGV